MKGEQTRRQVLHRRARGLVFKVSGHFTGSGQFYIGWQQSRATRAPYGCNMQHATPRQSNCLWVAVTLLI